MRNIFLQLILRAFQLRKSRIPTVQRGLILLLIDGLGYEELIYAVKKGYCPFIRKLLNGSYVLNPYYCGPPASTTATEAELFFGNHTDIPGFTWYDRKLRRFVRGNRGADIEAFEKAYQKKTEFLKDASCLLGVFSGGATQLDISGKDLDSSRPFKILRKLHVMIFIMNPVRLVYTVSLVMKSLFFSTISLIRKRSKKTVFRTLKDTIARILLGNIATYFAELELLRETPVLFIDFLLYDEFAHEYGMGRRTALSSLKLINWYCQSLFNMSHKTKRTYDFIILSDHGQTKSIPYEGLSSGSLEKLMSRASGIPKELILKTLSNPSENEFTQKKMFLVPAGSTLHVYFSDGLTTPLTLKEITASYPEFLKTLMSEKELGWILLRNDGSTQILRGKSGEALFSKGKVMRVVGDTFGGINIDPRTLDELALYAQYNNNGDVVIFGSIIPDGGIISFEDHKSTHGGFIGEMTKPFIITNNPHILNGIKDNNHMNNVFKTIRSSHRNNKL